MILVKQTFYVGIFHEPSSHWRTPFQETSKFRHFSSAFAAPRRSPGDSRHFSNKARRVGGVDDWWSWWGISYCWIYPIESWKITRSNWGFIRTELWTSGIYPRNISKTWGILAKVISDWTNRSGVIHQAKDLAQHPEISVTLEKMLGCEADLPVSNF